jgi:hypothetical protein
MAYQKLCFVFRGAQKLQICQNLNISFFRDPVVSHIYYICEKIRKVTLSNRVVSILKPRGQKVFENLVARQVIWLPEKGVPVFSGALLWLSPQHISSCCTVCPEQPETNNKIMAKIKLNVRDNLL